MKTLKEIEKILKENKAILAERFKVKEIGIFGSYVRGEQKKKMKQQSLKIFSKEETGPYALPKGWQWVKLGEVCEINPSKKEITSISNDLEVSFIPMDAVDEGKGEIVNSEIRKIKEVRKGYTYFKEEDVIFAKITPCMENGKCAIAKNLVNKLGFGSTEFHVIRPLNSVLSEWIWFYLRQQHIREEATKYFTGSVGQQRVPKEFLENLLLPLPPLPEQKRIVARIEALFSKIDEIKRLRKEANDLAKTLLQSALHEVFSKADEKGWKWVRLGEIVKKDKFSIVDGPFGTQLHTSDYVSSGVPLIRIKNFKYNFEFDESDLKFISEEKFEELKRSAVFPGDIILAKTGATIGKVCIFPSKFEKGLITSSCAKISVDRNIVDNKFVIFALATEKVQKQILILSSGSTRPSLTLSQVADLEIPLPFKNGQPALDEQKRIIAYLDTIQQKAQTLQKLQTETEKEIERLRETILHKAFRGEL